MSAAEQGAGNRPLTLADIANADDVAQATVDVPEWGGTVQMMALTGHERIKLMALIREAVDKHGPEEAEQLVAYQVVAASMVDGEGNRVDIASAADILMSRDGTVVQRLYDYATELSAIGQDEVDKRADALGEAKPVDGSSTD